MATELFEARVPAARPAVEGPGGPGGLGPLDGGGGGWGAAADPGRFGLWAFLGTVSMLFIGFTSAYIVRRSALDWQALPLPGLLWWNTAALLLSSSTLDGARREADGGRRGRWLAVTALLAVLFVAGQTQAWRVMAARGFFLSSNPHSSFFYLLSGVHLVHLGGGLVWFASLVWPRRGRGPAAALRALSLFATYWHFLALLWVYVMVLIFFF